MLCHVTPLISPSSIDLCVRGPEDTTTEVRGKRYRNKRETDTHPPSVDLGSSGEDSEFVEHSFYLDTGPTLTSLPQTFTLAPKSLCKLSASAQAAIQNALDWWAETTHIHSSQLWRL